MEPVGLTIGVVGLAGQLAKATMDYYKIFDDMKDVGSTYDAILHELRTQGLLLKKWEQSWGFGSEQQRLDPGDYRYRYATASLARIVAVFVSIDNLQAKYGIVIKQESVVVGAEEEYQKARLRDRLSVSMRMFRSKSLRRSSSTTQISYSGATKDDLHLLENPKILENKHILPGLDDEIISMTQAINRVQQSLPIYLKFRWVISDNAKLEDLLRKLTSLNNGLFQVLPTSESSLAASSNPSLLKLSFDIPFSLSLRKNPNFVGREYLLESLIQGIEGGKGLLNIIVLYGTGGMGKTQLALEYVYQHYNDYSSVFWVNATSVQTIILGFTQIMQQLIRHHLELSMDVAIIGQLLGMARKLDSTGCFTATSESDAQYVVDSVKRYFSAPGNTGWLLVFDNLDDLDLVDIEEYIPSCHHGTVIITSRRRESIQQGRRGFEVQQMHPTEAIQLLLSSCSIPKFEDLVPVEQTAATIIAQELGYLPLALNQAGAYIHISQYSLSRYLKEYPNNASYLLSKRWKGGQHDRSVFATWEISFKAIQEKSPKAAELLLVCGFLDHEDIQEELLRRGLKLENNDLSLKESIRTLSSYSLVKRGSSDDSFSIHPLVHSWARLRLKPEPQSEVKIASEAFGIITSGIHSSGETMSTEDWIFERQVMPHFDAVAKHVIQYLAVRNMRIEVGMHTLAAVYARHGWYGKAMEWYERVLAGVENAFGVNHPHTLTTVNNMASIFSAQGQYDIAIEYYERALAGMEKALGVDHPHTLTTVNNIAVEFKARGQYDKALEYCERAFAGREKALGVDHPGTLATINNMASIFSAQGQYDKAIEYYERALAGREKALGVDHPGTLATINNMASIFSAQGQYSKALEYCERALAGREKALGVDHPDTLTTVNNMASIFNARGQYDRALEYYERALAGREKALGVDHPDSLTTVNSIGTIYDAQGQHDKALEYYERALAGGQKALGVDHPDTLATVNNMAMIFNAQGQYDKALECCERVLAGREKALGVDHPHTLTTVNNMASIFDAQGQYDKALEYYERAFAGRVKALGVDHPHTLTTVNNMAVIFKAQGQYDKAIEYYERALAGMEKALGVDHPHTLTTVNNMALIFDAQGQHVKALEYYERALVGREKALGVDHPHTLATANNMAMIFNAQGQYGKALECYDRALVGRVKALGVDHPLTQYTIRCLIKLYERSGQTEPPNLRTRLTVPCHPTVQSRLLMLARLVIITVGLVVFVTFGYFFLSLLRSLSWTTELFETLLEAFFFAVSQITIIGSSLWLELGYEHDVFLPTSQLCLSDCHYSRSSFVRGSLSELCLAIPFVLG
ncbi:TPR-like protein, partial [Terfezia boudieri ATCC MYA-4762]